MKTFLTRSRVGLIVSVALLGGTSTNTLAADLVLQKVPPLSAQQASAFPRNLARHHLGARVDAVASSTSPDVKAEASALLSSDPTATCSLKAGTTTVLLALSEIENIGSIALTNNGAKGSIAVATSSAKLPANSPQWHDALKRELSADGLEAKIGPGEAKYVRLTFDLTQGGQIGGFGVYGNLQISDFTAQRRRASLQDDSMSFGLVSHNYTDMHAKARALYVSSGRDMKQANNMIDEHVGTIYSFAKGDNLPTTVIDLGKPVSLRHLSAVYSPRAGKMEFYVLPSLPSQSGQVTTAEAPATANREGAPTQVGTPTTVTFTEAALSNLKAVGSATDDGSQGRASAEFAPMSGRYVMVRWIPATQQDDSFSLAEVAASGGTHENNLLAANESSADDSAIEEQDGSSYDGKTTIDGKTMIDTKDTPGVGANPPGEGPPPSLPHPPPFTFVPVIVPHSP